jgi:hypothetical protein
MEREMRQMEPEAKVLVVDDEESLWFIYSGPSSSIPLTFITKRIS